MRPTPRPICCSRKGNENIHKEEQMQTKAPSLVTQDTHYVSAMLTAPEQGLDTDSNMQKAHTVRISTSLKTAGCPCRDPPEDLSRMRWLRSIRYMSSSWSFTSKKLRP